MHPATQYAVNAVEGSIVTGRWERLACLRHIYDLARAGQLPALIARRIEKATGRPVPPRYPEWPWYFDEEQATFVSIEWFTHLMHVEGQFAGQPRHWLFGFLDYNIPQSFSFSGVVLCA